VFPPSCVRSVCRGVLICVAAGVLAWSPALRAACEARVEDTDGDGTPDRVRLENEFVRLVFTPDGFGREFTYKPNGTDLMGGESVGLFHWDVYELPNWQQTSQKLPRPTTVAKDTPAEAAITMSLSMPATISRPAYNGVTLSQTLTLKRGVNAVFGRITARNDSGEDQPLSFREGIRKHSPGVVWAFYTPDIEGPRVAMDLEPGPYSYPVLTGTMPTAWMGGVNENGFGFAGEFEWKTIDMLECWCSKSPTATFQWAYRTQVLKRQKTWTTDFTIACFDGFDEVTGMADGVVGQLMVGTPSWDERKKQENKTQFPVLDLAVGKAVPITVKIAATGSRKLVAEFGARVLPDREFKASQSVPVEVTASSTGRAQFDWTPDREGTHVVAVRILDRGKPVLTMEKPFVIGATDQAYFAEMPAEEQVGETPIGALIAEPPLHRATTELDLDAVDIPRKRFGRNYARGPLSVLFVCQPKHDLVSARELYQRMDVLLDHIVVPDGHRGRTRKLLEKLGQTNPSVLFMSAYDWRKTPAPTLAATVLIRGRVERGMGLVMLADLNLLKNEKSPLMQFLKEARPLDDAPFLAEVPGKPVPARLFELGKGRIAVINGSGRWAYDAAIFSQRVTQLPSAYHAWDYGLSEWMKAVLWAGRHETGLRFAELAYKNGQAACRLLRDDATDPLPVSLAWTLFDEYAREESRGTLGATLVGTDQTVGISLPPGLAGGTHMLEVTALDGRGQVLRWVAATFEEPEEVSADIALDVADRFLEAGEALNGHVVLKQAKPAVRTLDLQLRVSDIYGRLIRDETRRVSFSETELSAPFSLDLWSDCRHDQHHLDVDVRTYDRVLCRARAEFALRWRPQRYLDDFAVGMWTCPGRDLLGYVTSMGARRIGMDYFYGDAAYIPEARRYNGPTCFSMGGKTEQDNKTLSYSPSLCDAEHIAKTVDAFKERVAREAKGDIRFWMVQDERAFRGEYDHSAETLREFRKWLEDRYGIIEELNAAWDGEYAEWGDVRPLTGAQFRERGRDPRNLACWLDFRLFMSEIWARWTQYAFDAVREVCPDGEVGMAGIFAPSIWSGTNFWLHAKTANVGGRYNGLQEEWYHSFDPDSRAGQWGGYRPLRPSAGNLLHPWRQLFHEGHFTWYYKYYANPGSYAYQGAFNCDGTVHGMYNAMIREHADIKEGIGRLLLRSDWLDDGICFPYSQATILANEFLDLPQTVYTAKSIVQNLGYQHRFLSYEQIADGQLRDPDRGVKLLFLPGITCLSLDEVTAIKDFVRRGGVLVADRLAGLRDNHGRTWPGGSPLDEVFGVDRTALGTPENGAVVFGGPSVPEALKDREITVTVPETGIGLRRGKAWATGPNGAPVVVVHRYGYGWGKAFYLNLDIGEYARMSGGGAVRPELVSEYHGNPELVDAMDTIFRLILAEAGIQSPRVRVASAEQAGSVGESFFWRNGHQQYFSFLPSVKTTLPGEITWTEPGFVYDMRTGRRYGQTAVVTLPLQPGRALVLSHLPYEVTGVHITRTRPGSVAYRRGETVVLAATVTAVVSKPDHHVFRIEVTGPDGARRDAHCRNVDAPGGVATIEIPVALNAPPGQWSTTVRDVATGMVAVERFEVVP